MIWLTALMGCLSGSDVTDGSLAAKSRVPAHRVNQNVDVQPAFALPYYESKAFTPRWLDEPPAGFHAVPRFAMTSHRQATITDQSMRGKVSVVSFFFSTCNGICPRLSDAMQSLADDTDPGQVVLLSFSVTPGIDTPERLAEFATERGLQGEHWHLLTGDRELTYTLGRDVFFVEEDLGKDKSPDDFLHTENLVLIDKDLHIRGVYNGLNRGSVAQLKADLRTLLPTP